MHSADVRDMRIALLSDIHANLEALKAVFDDMAHREAVDRVVCLGDTVGYNADPEECIAVLQNSGAVCVAGNHDRAVAGVISTDTFSDAARRAVEWTRARLPPAALDFLAGLPLDVCLDRSLIAVHGTLTSQGGCEKTYIDSSAHRQACLDALAQHASGARICAFGHTHHLGVFESSDASIEALHQTGIRISPGAFYLINPGSVGQPRGKDKRATYMVLDLSRSLLAVHHVPYRFDVAQTKTRKAGLAPRLNANRLLSGISWRVRKHVSRATRLASCRGAGPAG